MVFAPLIVRFKKKYFFIFDNNKYELFYHRYNYTWAKERAVEIPIAMGFIASTNGRIMELGNVLSHYFKPTWDIIDKYEKGGGVLNEDIETFSPKEKYDLIVAISTFEHIGYDFELDKSYSAEKIKSSFNNLKFNCLKKGGKLIITTPIGWNSQMDEITFNNLLHFKKISFMKRIKKNQWIQVSQSEAKGSYYAKPFPFANCISIGEYVKE